MNNTDLVVRLRDVDLEDKDGSLMDAAADAIEALTRWSTEQSTAITDLQRQRDEARAEVADLLPRLDAAAMEITQLARERDHEAHRADVCDEEVVQLLRTRTKLLAENAALRARIAVLEAGVRAVPEYRRGQCPACGLFEMDTGCELHRCPLAAARAVLAPEPPCCLAGTRGVA